MQPLTYTAMARDHMRRRGVSSYEVQMVVERSVPLTRPDGVREHRGVWEGLDLLVLVDRTTEPFLVLNVIVMRRQTR
jgi:hypothetical protein